MLIMSVNAIISILSYQYDQFTHINLEYKSEQVKYSVICHSTFKENRPLLSILSYWYEMIISLWSYWCNVIILKYDYALVDSPSNHSRLRPGQQIRINLYILMWSYRCEHIDMISCGSCWLHKLSFKTDVRAIDSFNLYKLIDHISSIISLWSYRYDAIISIWFDHALVDSPPSSSRSIRTFSASLILSPAPESLL